MSAPALEPLREAVTALAGVWAGALTAADLDRSDLVAVTCAIGSARRALDALQADVAAAIAHESRPELGADSLAKQQGFRNTAQLIATTTGTSAGDAARLVKVGEAIAPRLNLLGEPAPAKYPAVQAAATVGLWVLAAGQPLAGYVFVLDGVLIGAGDARYLALAGVVNLAVYAPALWLLAHAASAAAPDAGRQLALLWLGFAGVYLGMRALTLGWRARGDAWMRTGAE